MAIQNTMGIRDFKFFKYEITLGSEVPMPKPPIDFYPQQQFTVQQYLYTLCKENVGALGKKDGKWAFGEGCDPLVKIHSRTDIIQIFDYSEKLGIIIPDPEAGGDAGNPESFIPYKLSESYWSKFDKFKS